MSIKSDVLAEVVGAVLSTVVISTGAVIAGHEIADYVNQINPTCSNAVGLRPIPPKDLTVQGPQRSGRYPASNAVDGYLGSVWVPPLLNARQAAANGYSPYVPVFFPEQDRSTITLSLKKQTAVQLVCVNNGLGAGDTRYENFGKVRSVATWADDDSSRKTAILSSLPTEESSTLQEADSSLGRVKTVRVQLLDAYSGKDVVSYDPDQCGQPQTRYPVSGAGIQPLYGQGCVLSASAKAGLSEIVLYTDSSS